MNKNVEKTKIVNKKQLKNKISENYRHEICIYMQTTGQRMGII